MKAAVPRIVFDDEAKKLVRVDQQSLLKYLKELDVSDKMISKLTIYINTKNHYGARGTTWPGFLARFRFGFLSNIRGPVVGLNLKVNRTIRDEADINRTLRHELVHVAQIGRLDWRLAVGWAMIGYGAVIGITLGLVNYRLHLVFRIILAAILGLNLYSFGYWYSPHERQARKISETSKAKIVELV